MPIPTRLILLPADGAAQLVTLDDVAQVSAAKLPGGVVALSLTVRVKGPDVAPVWRSFTVHTDAATALEIAGEVLSAPGAAPVAEPVEAPPVCEPVAVEPSVGVVTPRAAALVKVHTGGKGRGGFNPCEREPKPRENVAHVVEAPPISPADLALLPRPLSYGQAAADVVNLGAQRLTTRELAARWGWSRSTVSVFLRSAAVRVHPDAAPVSLAPVSRAPDTRPIPELRAELDAVARPAPWALVARYLRRCVEADTDPGDFASLAARWGWDVAHMGHLWGGVVRQRKAA